MRHFVGVRHSVHGHQEISWDIEVLLIRDYVERLVSYYHLLYIETQWLNDCNGNLHYGFHQENHDFTETCVF